MYTNTGYTLVIHNLCITGVIENIKKTKTAQNRVPKPPKTADFDMSVERVCNQYNAGRRGCQAEPVETRKGSAQKENAGRTAGSRLKSPYNFVYNCMMYTWCITGVYNTPVIHQLYTNDV